MLLCGRIYLSFVFKLVVHVILFIFLFCFALICFVLLLFCFALLCVCVGFFERVFLGGDLVFLYKI